MTDQAHTTLRIDPPLPCGVLVATRRRCGNSATAATADRWTDGTWHILPMCESCVRATARVYGMTEQEKEVINERTATICR